MYFSPFDHGAPAGHVKFYLVLFLYIPILVGKMNTLSEEELGQCAHRRKVDMP